VTPAGRKDGVEETMVLRKEEGRGGRGGAI